MTTSAKSATEVKPMGDRVLVRPSDQEGVTKGGIFLPDTAQERPQQGEVLAVGPGRVLKNGKRVKIDMKAGDTVIYSKFAGTEISVADEDLLVLGANEILAVLS
ncbi:MAG: co-chaperone GroES [Chloroflexi bacterium]|nr:co-chaperone GroES [Chloroflexota bacterium]MDA1270879.1 co-chaperone GroES [Chloroflexota bacterium]PKB59572.1 MAG: co-chaperone GroES [SAR202 cluster bacterium Casp-Chloro-G2]